jgi:hypothetical protein
MIDTTRDCAGLQSKHFLMDTTNGGNLLFRVDRERTAIGRIEDRVRGGSVGSCIFNVLMVLGVASVVAPAGLGIAAGMLHFDLPVMVATAAACLPIFLTGRMIACWEGCLFGGYHAAHTVYLILASTMPSERIGSILMLLRSLAARPSQRCW